MTLKKFISIISCSAIILTGCSGQEEYNYENIIKEAQNSISDKDYENTLALFDRIREEDMDDNYYITYMKYLEKSDKDSSYDKAAEYFISNYENTSKDDKIIDIGNKYIDNETVSDSNKDKIKNLLGNKALEKTTETTTQKTIEAPKTETTTEAPKIAANPEFPKIYTSTIPDYTSCPNTDNYTTYADSYMSFAYPTKIYNNAKRENIDDGYQITFSGADGMSRLVYACRFGNFYDIKYSTSQLYNTLTSTLYNVNNIIYSDESYDHGRFIVEACTDSSKAVAAYILCTVEQNTVKFFICEYPNVQDETSTDYKNKGYLVDYLYRNCNFSGTTYRPRSFSQYLNDDMGTKK